MNLDRWEVAPQSPGWTVADLLTGEVSEWGTFAEASSELVRLQGLQPVTRTGIVEV